jgi:hypothetical protein
VAHADWSRTGARDQQRMRPDGDAIS